MTEPVIVVHGGAWAIPDKLAQGSVDGVKRAVLTGYKLLLEGVSALDAVQAAVIELENDPVFDAGYGAALNANGDIELDAMIMDGKALRVGAVAAVQNIANPVKLARLVLDKTEHCLLVGTGANDFAAEMQVPSVSRDSLVTPEAVAEYEQYKLFKRSVAENFNLRDRPSDTAGHDTVGAVALDRHGNVACATSTGGITAKRAGRVGDSPITGSGGYADNESGAVSCTGHGEAILKVCLAHAITSKIQQGIGTQEAAESCLRHMASRCSGSGGAIVVAADGTTATVFSTERMAWASAKQNVMHYGLNPDEDFTEQVTVKP